MALPYSTQAGKIAYQEATALWRAINFRAGDFKALRGLSADLKQLSSIRTGARAATNPISSAYKKLEFDINDGKKVTDGLKSGNWKAVGGKFASFMTLAFAALSVFGAIIGTVNSTAITQLSEITVRQFEVQGREFAIQFRLLERAITGLRGLDKTVSKLVKEQKEFIDRTYAEATKSNRGAIEARKMANDALYEVRQGRKILEERIASQAQSANTKISELTNRFNKALGNVSNNAQNTIQNTINKLQQQVAELQKPSNSNQEIPKLQQRVDTLFKTVETIPQNFRKIVEVNNDTVKKSVDAAFKPVQQAQRRFGVSITPATVTPASITYSTGGIVVPTLATVTPAQVTYSDFSTSDAGLQAQVKAEREADTLSRQLGATNGRVSAAFDQIAQARNIADAALREAKIKGIPVDTSGIDRRITTIEQNVNTRIGNIEKVNERSERKLDSILPTINQILPTLAGIPLIAARATADVIRPDIPTISGIEAATGRAMCRNLQTGCGRQAIDDAVGNINQHNTNNTGSVLDAINTGANAALLQGQQTILQRLGDQLPGGLSGKLQRFSKWLHLDRALNMMIWATTIHNALMLSSDIGQTLLGAINNVLQLFGLRDSEGQPFDLGSIISSSIENLIKGIIGADNYTQLRETWAKANRIYQATTNVLNAFQGLASAILTGLEMTAGKVAKIGNALRKSGEVLESAYGWMNPQPKFNRVTQFLENLQNGASTIQMVTQAPLDIINSMTELTNATTELTNAIQDDSTPNNQGRTSPEPQQLKASELASKIASAGLEMLDLDLEEDE